MGDEHGTSPSPSTTTDIPPHDDTIGPAAPAAAGRAGPAPSAGAETRTAEAKAAGAQAEAQGVPKGEQVTVTDVAQAGTESVTPPPAGEQKTIEVVPGVQYVFDFPQAQAEFVLTPEGDLAILVEGRGEIVLEGYADQVAAGEIPPLDFAGDTVAALDLLTQVATADQLAEIAPALGPAGPGPGNTGAAFDPFDPGPLPPSLADLGPQGPTALAFGMPEPIEPVFPAEGGEAAPLTLVINEVGLGVGRPPRFIGEESILALGPQPSQRADNFVELHNTGDAAVDPGGGVVELKGPGGSVVSFTMPATSVPAGGMIVFYQSAFAEVSADIQWVVFDDSGDPVTGGTLAGQDVWGLGGDTDAPLAVNVTDGDVSVDALLANGASAAGLAGSPSWTGAGASSASASAQSFAGFHDGLVGGNMTALVDNDTFNGRVGDQQAVLDLIGLDRPVTEFGGDVPFAGLGNFVFARTFGGDDVTPIDGDSEADWTTAEVPTDGALNESGLDLNPQDVAGGDDFDPRQGASAAEDEGQTVQVATAGNPHPEGGRGPDFLYGTEGESAFNLLQGQAHNDFLFGDLGADRLFGNSGADFLLDYGADGLRFDGGPQAAATTVTGDQDVLVGNSGDDILYAFEPPERVVEEPFPITAPRIVQGPKLAIDGELLVGDNFLESDGENGGQTPPGAFTIFVVDESGSMDTEHAFLDDAVADLDAGLAAEGVAERVYGLVGYTSGGPRGLDMDPSDGTTDGTGLSGFDNLFGDVSDFQLAQNRLRLTGGTEDGYLAIDFAVENYFPEIPEGSAINVVLVTDEDRDNTDGSLTFESILSDLEGRGALLNAVVDADLEDGLGTTALGVDSNGTAFIADGSGGFLTSGGGVATGGFGNTVGDYVDLAFDANGAVWDLNQLRAGGVTATSFAEAFVDVKVGEISEALGLAGHDVIHGSQAADLIFGDNAPPPDELDVSDPGVSNADIIAALQSEVVDPIASAMAFGGLPEEPANQDLLDELHGQGVSDSIDGGAGDDVVFGQGGDDQILAGGGDDLVLAGNGDDAVEGESGNDSLLGNEGADSIDGGPNGDVLGGGPGDDFLTGMSGDDRLFGGGDDDELSGGSDDDELSGGGGNDELAGGGGNDVLDGGDGEDTYAWAESDHGDTVNPDEDVVSSFDVGDLTDGAQAADVEDVLALSDVLGGDASNAGNTDWLEMTSGGTDTTLKINSSGGGASDPDLVVTVEGVDLTEGGGVSAADLAAAGVIA